MKRLMTALAVLALAACAEAPRDFEELDVADMHDSMQRGELSSEELVRWYLGRIESIDHAGPELRSIIEINPDALTIARALDQEWQVSGPRGPMHGIPVVLKANIDTADKMHTTAGSLALKDHIAAEDAFLVSRLRDAGAVILGKANLSEWANFRSNRSSSGWSSIGGQTKNPYDPTRNPCGSSSGSGVSVSANLTAVSVGTETDGSVVCPAGINGVVGIKPTVGLVSRSGIIPIAHSQDTAGPMARTVRDAAILLTAMTGTDPADADSVAAPPADENYAAGLAADALDEKRIGVISDYYGAGSNPGIDEILEKSIETIRAQGATVIEELEMPIGEAFPAEGDVLHYEFKADLNAYLEKSGTRLKSLAEIIEFNEQNADAVMPFFGQERMLAAEAKGPLTDSEYLEALETSRRITRDAIDSLMNEHELDALLVPTNGPAWKTDHANGDAYNVGSSSYAAISGYPNITVPAGYLLGLPIGLSFIGKPFAEKPLIEIAYAFEQATLVRKAPELAK